MAGMTLFYFIWGGGGMIASHGGLVSMGMYICAYDGYARTWRAYGHIAYGCMGVWIGLT